MLAAIGLMLILKQIPHALGYDANYEGDEAFLQPHGEHLHGDLARAEPASSRRPSSSVSRR